MAVTGGRPRRSEGEHDMEVRLYSMHCEVPLVVQRRRHAELQTVQQGSLHNFDVLSVRQNWRV